MRHPLKLLGVLTLLLTGCQQYDFRYHPATQPDPFNPIFVDYRVTPKTIDMLVDTHGIRLVSSRITLADGSIVTPLSIDQPNMEQVMIGDGTALGSVDDHYGVQRTVCPTVVHFDKAAVGPAPWKLMVQIAGTHQAYIEVGTPTSTGYHKPIVLPQPATQPATQPSTTQSQTAKPAVTQP